MAYAVRIAENADEMEVYGGEDLDSPRIDPNMIGEWIRHKVKDEVKLLVEGTLEWERDQQIQALRYERGVIGRLDYRNGYRHRELSTTFGSMSLRVPRGRRALTFSVLDAYQRRWRDLDALLLEAHVGGMSCQAVGDRVAALLGRRWSASTIAQLKKKLVEQLNAFRSEPLKDEYVALIIDGMYVRIRQCGKAKRPIVMIIGVKADGKAELLALKVCYSENSVEVEGLLRNVKQRGVTGVNLNVVTLDGDKGLESAAYAVYGQVRIQDCTFHRINRLHQNAQSKRRARVMMKEASAALSLTNRRDQIKAVQQFCDQWRDREPKAIALFEKRIESCFEAHVLPLEARSKATTTSLCEGLFKQIRARTNKIGAFETPSAVELLLFAIVAQKTWISIPGRPSRSSLIPFTHFS